MICGMPLLLHAAHIQTHTHIVSGFFVNPKYFQSHSFGAFSFHSKIWTKWWKKNGIDNKEIDAQLLHKNKRVCFRAEHSEMHRTWMIPIEQQKENEKKNRFGCVGFSVGFVRLMCHLVRQPNIDTFNNKKYKYLYVDGSWFHILNRSSLLHTDQQRLQTIHLFYLKVPKIDLMCAHWHTRTHATKPQIFMTSICKKDA